MSLALELHRSDGCPESGILPYQEIDHDIKRRRTSQRQRPPYCNRPKPPNAPTLRHGSAVLRPASQSRERRPARPNGGPKAKRPPNRPNPPAGAREGSKAAKVLGLLRQPDGA